MNSAIMLSQIFGPFLGIWGLWSLLYGDNAVKVMTATKNSPPALYFSALINLLIGLVIINSYNVWVWNAFFFLTLLGWFLFIWGIVGLFMPQVIVKSVLSKNSMIKARGIVPFVWGLILTWAGYYV